MWGSSEQGNWYILRGTTTALGDALQPSTTNNTRSYRIWLEFLAAPECISTKETLLRVLLGRSGATLDVVIQLSASMGDLKRHLQQLEPKLSLVETGAFVVSDWDEGEFVSLFLNDDEPLSYIEQSLTGVIRVDELVLLPAIEQSPCLIMQVMVYRHWNLTLEGQKEMACSLPLLVGIPATISLADLPSQLLDCLREQLAEDIDPDLNANEVTLWASRTFPPTERSLIPLTTAQASVYQGMITDFMDVPDGLTLSSASGDTSSVEEEGEELEEEALPQQNLAAFQLETLTVLVVKSDRETGRKEMLVDSAPPSFERDLRIRK